MCKCVENVPSDQVLGILAYSNVVREIEAMLPIDYLPVDVSPVFCAEWGPADETFEHDCPKGPLRSGQSALALRQRLGGGGLEMFAYPVTVKRVPITRQDLRCYVYDKLVPCHRAWRMRSIL